ncbi:MAG: hypothetical protein LIP09_14630 [Bacteroidales bacterium]|nr:hypothetical protein [Bacteroidales bacterium]
MDKKRFIIVILLCWVLLVPDIEAAQQWEQVRTEIVSSDSVGADRPEVTASEGYIYVTTPRAVTVKVFSIVGQLISEVKLPAGTSRLKMGARGIYIVKAGETTLRITI